MENRPQLIPGIIVAILLLIALADLPYGYYQFLRWAVCGMAIFMVYVSYSSNIKWFMWVFIVIAVLFNPIIPIHLNREIWRPIDIVSAIIFLGGIALKKK